MDRFVSGQSTNKFEVPLPTNIMDGMNRIQAGQLGVSNEFQAFQENFKEYQERIDGEFYQIHDKLDRDLTPVRAWYDQNQQTLIDHNYQLENFMCNLARSRFIRFLNFFFHWFEILIVENRFPMHGQHDRYFAYVHINKPDELYSAKYGSDEHKQYIKQYYKDSHKRLKIHLKEIKEFGYNLSNIRFRF